jgi:hypothetical protein
MDLFGKHQISYESIRRLAIECHALDSTAIDLLIDTTINKPATIKPAYEELFSEKLLALAIGLRTKFYQGVPHSETYRFIGHSAFLFSDESIDVDPQPFTIKDVCDKIIHANIISRPLDDGTRQPVTQVRGKYKCKEWVLHISTSLFCQGVLNWLETLESKK